MPHSQLQGFAQLSARALAFARRMRRDLMDPQVLIVRRAPLWRMAHRVLAALVLMLAFWGLYQWGYRNALLGYPVLLSARADMILERRQLLDELAQARQHNADLQVQAQTRGHAMEQLRLDLHSLGLAHQDSLNALALYRSIMDPRADDPAVAVEHASIERLGGEYSLRFILVRRDGTGLQPGAINVEAHLQLVGDGHRYPGLQIMAENPAKIALRRLQAVVLPLQVPEGPVPLEAELRVDFGTRYEPITVRLEWPKLESDYVKTQP